MHHLHLLWYCWCCTTIIIIITTVSATPSPPNTALTPTQQRPVCGFADLHNHQFAHLGFGGNSFRNSATDKHMDDEAMNVGFINKVPHPYQQIHESWLKQAHVDGLNLLVVTAVNNQVVCLPTRRAGGAKKFDCADMSAVQRQVTAIREFAQTHSDWYEIVTDPWAARRAIHAGKMAVVMAVEVSNLFDDKFGKWEDQFHTLYNQGVRIIQMAHETNSRFAGAAPHNVVFNVLNTLKEGHPFKIRNGRNVQGLTDLGHELLDMMMRKHMVIDVAHLSLKSVDDVFKQLSEYGAKHMGNGVVYPMMDSHCRLKPLLSPRLRGKLKEFLCDRTKIDYVKRAHGLIGLRNGPERMITYHRLKPSDPPPVKNNCDGSSASVAQMNQLAARMKVNVAWGSDLNGFALMNSPRFGADACANPAGKRKKARLQHRRAQAESQTHPLGTAFDTKGAATIAQFGDLIRDMYVQGATIDSISHSAENFLKMWERAYLPSVRTTMATSGGGGSSSSKMVCAKDDYHTKGNNDPAYLQHVRPINHPMNDKNLVD